MASRSKAVSKGKILAGGNYIPNGTAQAWKWTKATASARRTPSSHGWREREAWERGKGCTSDSAARKNKKKTPLSRAWGEGGGSEVEVDIEGVVHGASSALRVCACAWVSRHPACASRWISKACA